MLKSLPYIFVLTCFRELLSQASPLHCKSYTLRYRNGPMLRLPLSHWPDSITTRWNGTIGQHLYQAWSREKHLHHKIQHVAITIIRNTFRRINMLGCIFVFLIVSRSQENNFRGSFDRIWQWTTNRTGDRRWRHHHIIPHRNNPDI